MKRVIRSLDQIVAECAGLKQIRREELFCGDVVIITTRNSIYSVKVLENDRYAVSGGWFDREGLAPAQTTIAGCTWGGSVIKADIIAACGLCVEFGNHLMTSAIQKIVVIRQRQLN